MKYLSTRNNNLQETTGAEEGTERLSKQSERTNRQCETVGLQTGQEGRTARHRAAMQAKHELNQM